jgi:SOS-response transcriptional repressor LexA
MWSTWAFGNTTPDVIFRPDPADDLLKPVAIYLDGLSAHIHGNPETAQRDKLIRSRLREIDWEVMAITAHELHDHEAMARHFARLARYLDQDAIKDNVRNERVWFDKADSQEFGKSDRLESFVIIQGDARTSFVNCLPLIENLPIAAGNWGDEAVDLERDLMSVEKWVQPPEGVQPEKGMFIARVTGSSMEPKVPNGAWCVFKRPPGGGRNGKDLLVWNASLQDPEGMGRFTLKRYKSEWVPTEDGPRQAKITLSPLNPDFQPIVLTPENENEVRVVAELHKVL